MKRHIITLKCLRITLCLISMGLIPANICIADENGRSLVNCDIQHGACTQLLNGYPVTFNVMPKPVKSMAELDFSVIFGGPAPKGQPYIKLNMLAMDMGDNRVILKPDSRGGYMGQGVVVRCRSGIRTWSAKVTFPNAGTVEFIFDVIY